MIEAAEREEAERGSRERTDRERGREYSLGVGGGEESSVWSTETHWDSEPLIPQHACGEVCLVGH